jgi:methylenetetrahydrofolate dehydrogenase (NADP+)/methenyltetrahydrofolate cyclohydrolase
VPLQNAKGDEKMPATLLEGKPIADKIKEDISRRLEALKARGVAPKLVAILAGGNPGAVMYAKSQRKACEALGIAYELKELGEEITQAQLEQAIRELNEDRSVTGILLLMPVPKQINGRAAQNVIAQKKDVDGVSPANAGMVVFGRPRLGPCTAMSAVTLIKSSGVDLYGKEVVVVGNSEIVGKPVALLLCDKYATADESGKTDKLAGATVTICHIGTSERGDLGAHTRRADVLVSAVGVRPGLIRGDMIKPGAVVVDVATIRHEGKTVGDVDFEAASEVAGMITPVPGGVGVVTTAILLQNTVEAAEWQLEAGAGG